MTTNALPDTYTDMSQPEKIRMAAFLIDTCLFYNLGNRAVFAHKCLYRSVRNSPGCALGRHVAPKVAAKADAIPDSGKAWEIIMISAPPWLSSFNFDFLANVQGLHDAVANWADSGISTMGVNLARRIAGCHGFLYQFSEMLSQLALEDHPLNTLMPTQR